MDFSADLFMSLPDLRVHTLDADYTVELKKSPSSITVFVYKDGELVSKKVIDIFPEWYSLRIWRLYETAKAGNFVARSGLGLFGCYNEYDPAAAPNYQRTESATEHASDCVTLARNLQNFYPNLFSISEYERIITLLEYHDIGENTYGDRPDDGSQNTAEKDSIELASFTEFCLRLPPTEYKRRVNDFIHFQHCQTTGSDYLLSPDVRLAQFARLIDKVEAILSGLIREKHGYGGTATYKEKCYSALTEQDRLYIKETGTTKLVDCWSAHFLHDYHTYAGFAHIINILHAAVVDVRGKWFPWYDNFCQKHHIRDVFDN